MMRRRTLAGLAILALVTLGGAVAVVADAQIDEATVTTQTFTHEDVVTYTIPTETVVSTETGPTTTVIETQTVTTTETVTVTAPTTTAPPTTTEPEPPQGTIVTTTSGTRTCNQPLSSYGPLPITFRTMIPNGSDSQNGDLRIGANCTGDGTNATDIILDVRGDGGDLGSGDDCVVLIDAHDLQVEGNIRCGRVLGGAHQDCVQLNGAHRVTFRNVDMGLWETGTPGCHGAGGGWYVSSVGNDPARLTDTVCDGCRIVTVNQAWRNDWSTRSGARNSCLRSRIPFASNGQDIDPVRGPNNLFIDTDSSAPQPLPSECQA